MFLQFVRWRRHRCLSPRPSRATLSREFDLKITAKRGLDPGREFSKGGISWGRYQGRAELDRTEDGDLIAGNLIANVCTSKFAGDALVLRNACQTRAVGKFNMNFFGRGPGSFEVQILST